MSSKQLLSFARHWVVEEFKPGAIIYKEGDPCDSLFIVCTGLVQLLGTERRSSALPPRSHLFRRDRRKSFAVEQRPEPPPAKRTPKRASKRRASKRGSQPRYPSCHLVPKVKVTGAPKHDKNHEEEWHAPTLNLDVSVGSRRATPKAVKPAEERALLGILPGQIADPEERSSRPESPISSAAEELDKDQEPLLHFLSSRQSGSCFGERGIFRHHATRQVTAATTNGCLLLSITKEDLNAFMKRFPECKMPIRRTLSSKVDRLLKQVPLFSSLRDPELEELASLLQQVPLDQDEVLFGEGDLDPEGNSMFIVFAGELTAVSRPAPDKAVHILAMFRQGDCFGEVGMMLKLPRTATIIANSRCLVLELRRPALDAFLEIRENKSLVDAVEKLVHVRLMANLRKYNIPFLEDVPESALMSLLSGGCQVVECNPGEMLIRQGEVATQVFVIVHGNVRFFVEKKASRRVSGTNKTIESQSVRQLVLRMQEPQTGVNVADRVYRTKQYTECFVASEAVKWLVSHGVMRDTEEAVSLCRELVHSGFIADVCPSEKEFSNTYSLFRFTPLARRYVRNSNRLSMGKEELTVQKLLGRDNPGRLNDTRDGFVRIDLDDLGAGNVLGEMALVEEKHVSNMNAQARTYCVVLVMDRERLCEVLEEAPTALARLEMLKKRYASDLQTILRCPSGFRTCFEFFKREYCEETLLFWAVAESFVLKFGKVASRRGSAESTPNSPIPRRHRRMHSGNVTTTRLNLPPLKHMSLTSPRLLRARSGTDFSDLPLPPVSELLLEDGFAEMQQVAFEIIRLFVRPNSEYEINIESSLRLEVTRAVENGQVQPRMFDECKDKTLSMLEMGPFSRFKQSEKFRALLKELDRDEGKRDSATSNYSLFNEEVDEVLERVFRETFEGYDPPLQKVPTTVMADAPKQWVKSARAERIRKYRRAFPREMSGPDKSPKRLDSTLEQLKADPGFVRRAT